VTEFCSLWWDADGYTHACLKPEGHDPPHNCACDYPGGADWNGPVYKTAHAVLAARTERNSNA
jgi:hypothetical protein